MVIEYFLFAFGLYLLIKGAHWIVDGASSLAKKWGVSAMIIGLTVVAFGTSLPELVVNLFATLNGSGEMVFGNIVGSNIANILLVLGITAMIGNINIRSSTIWRQIPFALLASFVLFVFSTEMLFSNGEHYLDARVGLIFLSLFAIFLYYIYQSIKREPVKVQPAEPVEIPNWKIYMELVVGLFAIYFGGLWVVEGAMLMASQFGLSEFVISATIIAMGTSLPELVVSVIAVLKGRVDLAVGNVIGSNIFNILWVLGIVPLVGRVYIPSFVSFDIAVMFFATLLLFIFMFVGTKHELRRKEGASFVLLYILYIIYILWRG